MNESNASPPLPTLKTSATRVTIGVGCLLLIPLLGQLTLSEMNWGFEDFIAAGLLLFGAGMACAWFVPRIKTEGWKLLACTAIVLTLATVWAELAVGLFD